MHILLSKEQLFRYICTTWLNTIKITEKHQAPNDNYDPDPVTKWASFK